MESTIGLRLKQYREAKEMRQNAFCERAGIRQQTLSTVETGRSEPSMPFLKSLLGAYPDLNPDWLLLGTGPMLRDGRTLTPAPTTGEPEPRDKVPANYGATVELAIVRARLDDRDGVIEKQATEIARLNRELGKPSNGFDAAGPVDAPPSAPRPTIGFRLAVSGRVRRRGAASPF